MSRSPRGDLRVLRPALIAAAMIGIPLFVLTGCAADDADAGASPVAGAITACLAAAQEEGQFELPADDGGVDISVEVDHQGWWAVVAATRGADATRTLTCTAVPDSGPLGARAASWPVSDA